MGVPLSERARHILDLRWFKENNSWDYLGQHALHCPHDRQYILRMIIRHGHGEYKIPDELMWLHGLIMICDEYQRDIVGIRHLCTYVTVRHGEVTSQTDDEWHTDGFSTAISHLPEQNYIISSNHPTEYSRTKIDFPSDFNPRKHNVHKYIQKRVQKTGELLPHGIYCVDPYWIHRRPPNIPVGTVRTMVRISHVPIEIMDDKNTPNPLLPMPTYNRDGVGIRNKLLDYDQRD